MLLTIFYYQILVKFIIFCTPNSSFFVDKMPSLYYIVVWLYYCRFISLKKHSLLNNGNFWSPNLVLSSKIIEYWCYKIWLDVFKK